MGAKSEMNVTRFDNVTVSKMETLLADGPVGALMMVDSALQAYKSGVYTGCPNFANAFATINHAVVIVGMDADKNYIIKNSWGTRWGDSGFATISSVNDCALSAYVFQISWGYQLLGSSLIFFIALLVFAF
jgi:cathepsin L